MQWRSHIGLWVYHGTPKGQRFKFFFPKIKKIIIIPMI
jgi:hypothetical protein